MIVINIFIAFIILENYVIGNFVRKKIINKNFYKNQVIKNGFGTGEEVANKLLHYKKLDIPVEYIDVELGDCYNVKNRVIYLSRNVFSSDSLSAMVVASHEVGHCISFNRIYNRYLEYKNLFNLAFIVIALITLIFLIISGDFLFYLGFVLINMVIVLRVIEFVMECDAVRLGKNLLIYNDMYNKKYEKEMKEVFDVSINNGIYKVMVLFIPWIFMLFWMIGGF